MVLEIVAGEEWNPDVNGDASAANHRTDQKQSRLPSNQPLRRAATEQDASTKRSSELLQSQATQFQNGRSEARLDTRLSDTEAGKEEKGRDTEAGEEDEGRDTEAGK